MIMVKEEEVETLFTCLHLKWYCLVTLSFLFMPAFYTIKQAVDHTGKSASTVRRLVREIVADDKHKDRAEIEPTPAEAKKMTQQGIQFAWKISEELLLREFKTLSETAQTKTAGESELAELLRGELMSKENQLKTKDTQIEQLGTIITSLNERLREGNVLMAALHQQIQLPQQTATAQIEEERPTEVKIPEIKVMKAKQGKQKAMNKIQPMPKASQVTPVTAPVGASKTRKRSWLAVIFG